MHFDNDGNTGIGTTSPSQKLEVAGNTLINNSGDGKLYLGSTSDYIGNIGSDIYMYSSGQNIFYSVGLFFPISSNPTISSIISSSSSVV